MTDPFASWVPRHGNEQIEDFAMRMAWAGTPEEAKRSFRIMADAALDVVGALTETAQLNRLYQGKDDEH